ncbi:MAG: DUF2887 domain-containing protein, partial [Cyanobacteriota bacterium]
MLSDKLFFWLFQSAPDRIVALLEGMPEDAKGCRFTAPVLKEREYRRDGLFLPPSGREDLPAVILEAQMAADPGFLRRLYAEAARLLQQEPEIGDWCVVVITPSRQLNFGAVEAVAEFVERRVRWVELEPGCWEEPVPLLQRVLGLLLQPELEIVGRTRELREQALATEPGEGIDELIAAILVTRFPSRSIPEICAMGGITVEEFSQSRIYREIVGIGEARGLALGEARGK